MNINRISAPKELSIKTFFSERETLHNHHDKRHYLNKHFSEQFFYWNSRIAIITVTCYTSPVWWPTSAIVKSKNKN